MSKWLVIVVLTIGFASAARWSLAQELPEAKAPLQIIPKPSDKIVPMTRIGFNNACSDCLHTQEAATKRENPVQPPDKKAADKAPKNNADDLLIPAQRA